AHFQAVAVGRGVVAVVLETGIGVRAVGVLGAPVLLLGGGIQALGHALAGGRAGDRADGAAHQGADRAEQGSDRRPGHGTAGSAHADAYRVCARCAGDRITVEVTGFVAHGIPPAHCPRGPFDNTCIRVVHGSCALCQAGMNGRQGIHDFGHCGGYAARRRIGSFPGWSPAMSRSLVLLLAGLLSPVSLLAADPPREVAGRVAAATANESCDPAAGTRIAGALGRASDNGAFDRLQDPRELATALSDRLRPLDRHFVVRWSPPGTEPPGPQRGPVRDPATSNFGIRRVQLLPGNIGYLELGYFADIDFDD